jgi:hypothetical protein
MPESRIFCEEIVVAQNDVKVKVLAQDTEHCKLSLIAHACTLTEIPVQEDVADTALRRPLETSFDSAGYHGVVVLDVGRKATNATTVG